MIETVNHGPLLVSSTYWESEWAARGYYYLSPNAGALRLLCPPGKGKEIAEMRTGKVVVVTIGIVRAIAQPGMEIGREMTEIMFDDRSDEPFALFLSMDQWERRPAPDDAGREWVFSAWEGRRLQAHQVLNRPCHLRRADLPCLKPSDARN